MDNKNETNNEEVIETTYEELMNPELFEKRHSEKAKEQIKQYKKSLNNDNNQLDNSKPWYIAATHYLTALFAIPLITSLIYTFFIHPFLPINSHLMNWILSWVVWLIWVVLWIIYSSKYLHKTYVINTQIKEKVIKLTTIYLIVLSWIMRLRMFVIEWFSTYFIMDLVLYIILIAIFYVLSNKYIKTNS